MNTRLASIQDALKAAIVAQTPGCGVCIGYPVGGFTKRQHMVVSGEATVTPSQYLSGYAQRDERTEIDVLCVTEQVGSSYTDVRDLTIALVGKVEAAIADDRTLGGVVDTCEVSTVRFEESSQEKRRGCGARVTVVCEGSSA